MESQKDSKSLHKPVASWVYLAAGGGVAAILLVNKFPQIFGYAAFGLLVAVVVWHVSEKQRVLREYQARHSSWASICGPEIISSADPNETVGSLHKRAAEFRVALKASENPYWNDIPIVVFPYSPMTYGQGELTMSWPRYKREVGEKQHMENIKWMKQIDNNTPLYELFKSQVMGLVDESKLETA